MEEEKIITMNILREKKQHYNHEITTAWYNKRTSGRQMNKSWKVQIMYEDIFKNTHRNTYYKK